MFVYLDNILVFSRSAQEHVLNIQQVPQRPPAFPGEPALCQSQCEFHRFTISFLGYIIAGGNVQMDPGKVRGVVVWPQPPSRVQLQCFLGFSNFYRRIIRSYSTLSSPLSALASPKITFTWSPAADQTFLDLMHRFTTAPILIHPAPSCQFVV